MTAQVLPLHCIMFCHLVLYITLPVQQSCFAPVPLHLETCLQAKCRDPNMQLLHSTMQALESVVSVLVASLF